VRYFAELAYNGSQYVGWQKQPNGLSVQAAIEAACSTILGVPIETVGCGRTDTGVHASRYFLHFDYDGIIPQGFLNRINRLLAKDIVIFRLLETPPDAHARFDAYQRSYTYYLTFVKNPFAIQTVYHYPYAQRPDFDRMQAAAQLLLAYREFYPFCKSDHDAKTLHCELSRCEWISPDAQRLEFHITANRFLRGMVRLIVGMCLHVGLNKLTLEQVKTALETQTPLPMSWSVPPEGLFLTDVQYEWM
jgi:tRNA pseudouridine38-40 synthase